MTNQHPITPLPELVQQWIGNYYGCPVSGELAGVETAIATHAAQWGADQELLACGNYLKQCVAWEEEDVIEFYNYRRPKPSSLKEQALAQLSSVETDLRRHGIINTDYIRRALEQLDD